MSRLPLVIVESPYAGDVEANVEYLRECLHDSLTRGEAPFASHGLYTQPGVLDDLVDAERRLGIYAGAQWMEVADFVAVYEDLGISPGMKQAVTNARILGKPVKYRRIR